MKKWAQQVRKWHRWIAIPMFVLVPVAAMLKLTGNGTIMKDVPAFDAVQSLLLILLVLTGGYLYVFRLINRKKRMSRTAAVIASSSRGPT
ncbi:MAG: hypothetical protein U9R51_10385 [Actinomycetota bacterium]|nr:hypothetical protein [Actinomycetota bacterium]